jgi:hypothetical protein
VRGGEGGGGDGLCGAGAGAVGARGRGAGVGARNGDSEGRDDGIRKVILLRIIAIELRTTHIEQAPMQKMEFLSRMVCPLRQPYIKHPFISTHPTIKLISLLSTSVL